jgi:putative hemolysin
MATMILSGLVVAVCLALSFLFSGMEAGVFALNRLRLRHRLRAGDRSARVLLGFLEHPEDFLWTILVGNTLANFFAVGLVATALYARLLGHGSWFLFLFLLFVFLLYALGDLLPKMLFQRFPNRYCLALARPFRFVHMGLSPLVSLLAWFSRGILRWTGGQALTGRLFGNREELRLIMQESAQGLSKEERSMINRVMDFQSLTVRQVTVPLEKVVTVTPQTPMAEVLRLCREQNLTRLLVEQSERGRRRILGLVSLKTLLFRPEVDPAKTAGDFVKPAQFMNADLRLEEALRRMQRSGQRVAVVLDRNQQELGIITLQNILKAIFGEISF